MKKSFYFLVLIYCALMQVFTVSCNKTPTYEELKADEKKLIRRILAENDIDVLHEYPTSGVFGENQFVELSSGIYLNVVDSGNGQRAVLYETDVLVRASLTYYDQDKEVSVNLFSNTNSPFEFKYGFASRVVSEYASAYTSSYYGFFSIGLESILSYVGDSAVVKLIIPGYSEISNYPAGSSFQSSNSRVFIPIYYDRVRYTFWQ